MSKSLVEFKRFLTKSAPKLSENEKKLANLILGRFDEVAVTETAGGRRGRFLAKLIVDNGEAVSPELEGGASVPAHQMPIWLLESPLQRTAEKQQSARDAVCLGEPVSGGSTELRA